MSVANISCNCVKATNLLNKIIALLECELTKNDITRILEMFYTYISITQHGFYVTDLVNIIRLLEIGCDRIRDVSTFKEVLHQLLNVCKSPPYMKVSSDVLRYAIDLRDFFSVLGYLLLLVEDIDIQKNVIETLISLLETPSKYKNQLPLEFRQKQANSGRLQSLLGQALFLINDKLFTRLLDLTFKLIVDCPSACVDLAINDALNSLCTRIEDSWRSRFPDTHPVMTQKPIFKDLNMILAILNVIVVHLSAHREILEHVPVITRFSLWNIKYVFHHVTIVTKLPSTRNSLITFILCIMDLFPTMDFVPSGLGEVLINDGIAASQNKYDLMWNWGNDSEEGFYFLKVFLFCLSLFVKFPFGKANIEKYRVINKILRLINVQGKKNPPIEHACVIKILAFKIFNKMVPHLEEEFLENSGPVILLDVLKNLNPSKLGLTVALNCLDTLRCVMKMDSELFVLNSILFNDGFNILMNVCKDILKHPEFSEKAQMCLEEIFSILTKLFDSITDLTLINLSELVEIPKELFNRFLRPNHNEYIYDNRIIINVMNFVWDVIIKHKILCDLFFKQNGVYIMLDIMQAYPMPVQMITLGALVDLCEYSDGKCIPYLITWKGKNGLTFIPLLMEIFRTENKLLGVQTGPNGIIGDGDHPLMGKEQYEQIFKLKDFRTSPSVADMYASCRPKIYALLTLMNERYRDIFEISNENYKTCNENLSAQDMMTLLLAENYLGLKFGEAWEELRYEFDQMEFKPLATDASIISSLVDRTRKWGRMLKELQQELLDNEKSKNLAAEHNIYNKLRNGRISAALESINEAKYIARCTERMFRIAQKFSQISQVEKSMAKIQHGTSVHKTFMSTIPITRVFKQNVSFKSDFKIEDEQNETNIYCGKLLPDQDYTPRMGKRVESSKDTAEPSSTKSALGYLISGIASKTAVPVHDSKIEVAPIGSKSAMPLQASKILLPPKSSKLGLKQNLKNTVSPPNCKIKEKSTSPNILSPLPGLKVDSPKIPKQK